MNNSTFNNEEKLSLLWLFFALGYEMKILQASKNSDYHPQK